MVRWVPRRFVVDCVLNEYRPSGGCSHHACCAACCGHSRKILSHRYVQLCYSIEPHRDNITPAYTEAINLLDYSVVVIPVSKADKAIDLADPDYKPLNDLDAKNWQACR